jgi:[acyl-carrier-protein] S-malonyltransferase
MGGDSLDRPGPVRALLERAAAALQVDLVEAVREGGPQLMRTEVCQPALCAVGIGLALELLAAGQRADVVAGHSVGELAAVTVAGCLEPEEAMDCAVQRGLLMAEAARRAPGGMAALKVEREEEVEAAIALGARAGPLELAAHNAPGEWVLTGAREALDAVAARYPTVRLPVAGPWHSRAMASAAERWRESLGKVRWRRPRIPVVTNAEGRFLADGEDVGEVLARQLTAPVRWRASLQTMRAAEVTAWHVIGPARVLRGLCRLNLGSGTVVHVHEGRAAA